MTTYPRLIYDNLWRKGGNAIASTPPADPQHPLSDTMIDTLSMFWKSSDKDVVTQYIPMDLKAGTRSINFVAILGHNIIEAEGQNITVEEDNDSDFGSITAETDAFTWQEDNIFQFLATPLTERYIRVKLVKTGGGSWDAAPKIATILCGSFVEFNRRPQKGYTLGKEDITEIEETDSRVIFAQEKDPLNEYRYIFEALNNEAKTAILAFLEECRMNRAFVWCTDYAAANTSSIFVRNTEIIYPVFQYPNVWNWEIAMREII